MLSTELVRCSGRSHNRRVQCARAISFFLVADAAQYISEVYLACTESNVGGGALAVWLCAVACGNVAYALVISVAFSGVGCKALRLPPETDPVTASLTSRLRWQRAVLPSPATHAILTVLNAGEGVFQTFY